MKGQVMICSAAMCEDGAWLAESRCRRVTVRAWRPLVRNILRTMDGQVGWIHEMRKKSMNGMKDSSGVAARGLSASGSPAPPTVLALLTESQGHGGCGW